MVIGEITLFQGIERHSLYRCFLHFFYTVSWITLNQKEKRFFLTLDNLAGFIDQVTSFRRYPPRRRYPMENPLKWCMLIT